MFANAAVPLTLLNGQQATNRMGLVKPQLALLTTAIDFDYATGRKAAN
jgi:hypothetical protein